MKRNQRLEVLEKLKAARTAGTKRTSQYEVEEKTDEAFEDLTEEEYQRRVQANKKKKFIVDDYGLGYDDGGEMEYEDEELEGSPQKKAKPETKPITSFLRPAAKGAKAKVAPKPKVGQEDSLELMKRLMENEDFEEEEQPAEQMEVELPPPLAPVLVSEKIKAQEESKSQAATRPPSKAPVVESQSPSKAVTQPPRKRPAPGSNLPEPSAPIPEEDYTNVQPESPPQASPVQPLSYVTPNPTPEEVIEPPLASLNLDETQSSLSSDALRDLPLNSDGQISIYWLDAHEDREVSPGSVMLFGKVWVPSNNKYESICVVVKDVPRVMFFQPASVESETDFMHTFAEVEAIRKNMRIPEIKCKIVKRNYAFELPGVPLEPSKYLKVMYSGKYPPFTHSRGEHFKRVFGVRNSLMENLLIKRRLKGPCWVRIQAPLNSSHHSFCRYEFSVPDFKHIIVSKEDINIPVPPLTVLSMYLQTFRNDKHKAEIVAVGGVVNREILQDVPTTNYEGKNQSFAIIRKLFTYPQDVDKVSKSKIADIEQSEKALLNNLMAKIQLIDPDFLIAHDMVSSTMDVLLERMQACGCGASKLGRLNRSRLPTGKGKEEYYQAQNWVQRVATCGRLMCDTFLCTKELIKEPTYTLEHLAQAQLGLTFKELEREDLPPKYLTSKELADLAKHCVSAALLPLALVMKLSVLPLSKQLTNIAGNLWTRSLQQARAERNEMLLLHEFHKLKYICPDKTALREKTEKKRANAYTGGLVLEPKVGLYDKFVVLLDFNSLYPSIIREHNICFTTVIRPRNETEEDQSTIGEIPDSSSAPGVLPMVIKSLVDRRKSAKESLKKESDPLRKQQLEIKQIALKLTANSMYGCLGFKNSRFFAMPIAALITQQGRRTLEKAVSIVTEELHLDVIYGDTDSIMINTNLDVLENALKLAGDAKQRINKEFRCLEIDIDGVFQSILLYKKKKYASIKLLNGVPTKEIKGLDLVRRDWSALTKQVSHLVLDVILSGRQREEIVSGIHETLNNFHTKLRANEFPLTAYVITKQLTKPIAQYTDIKAQPHVTVAKRMEQQGQTNLLNHFIPYIICRGDDPCVSSRAFSLTEVQSSGGALIPDMDWYINQQILPPTLRLCGVIDGTDCGRLAMIFGQDPSKYQSTEERNEDSGELPVQAVVSNLAPITVTCDQGHSNVFERAEKENAANGLCCTFPGHVNGVISTKKVHNRMMQILREAINQFYAGWVRCEEPLCPTRCKQSALERCPRKGCKKPLLPEMSAARLHSLFYYFLDITTITKASTHLPPEDRKAIKSLHAGIQALLDQSLYQHMTFEGHERKTEIEPACVLRTL